MRIKEMLNELNSEEGFNLLELLIVISIMGLIFVMVANGVKSSSEDAERGLNRMALSRLAGTLETYRLRHRSFPSTEEGLQALVKEKALKKAEAKDTYGNEISYEKNGRDFTLTSSGADGEFGTEDDIIYTSADEEDE